MVLKKSYRSISYTELTHNMVMDKQRINEINKLFRKYAQQGILRASTNGYASDYGMDEVEGRVSEINFKKNFNNNVDVTLVVDNHEYDFVMTEKEVEEFANTQYFEFELHCEFDDYQVCDLIVSIDEPEL